MTPYDVVFESFLKKIEDNDLPKFDEDEQIDLMTGWLDTAIGYIELDCLEIKNDLSDRDNNLQRFNCELLNCEIEVIALYMVAAWYEPRINSLEHTLMFVGSKEEKWTSQKEHMQMLMQARDSWKLKGRKYFRNYGLKNNSYLEGE